MLHRKSLAEQCASHLTGEVARGRWVGRLPGVDRLSGELGVSRETVRAALRILEARGHLAAAGSGRHRRIVPAGERRESGRGLRVALLLHGPFQLEPGSGQALFLQIRQALEEAGHRCVFCPKSQQELDLNVCRIARLVEATPVDAWLAVNGSAELLEWLSRRPQPVLALGGRIDVTEIAGVGRDSSGIMRGVFRELIAMGHRRIVIICARQRRVPRPGVALRLLEEELGAAGIPYGPFNAPEWEESPEGLQALMESLFRLTPPTALQVAFPEWMTGVLAFLSRRGLRVPQDVSLVCEYMDTTLAWHVPKIAHLHFDTGPVVGHVVKWVADVAAGHDDRQVVSFPSAFERGDSLASVSAR